MVKTLPTVERSTQIRFGKHAQQDQGENTIVLNASNTAVDASNGGAVYVSPVRFDNTYEGKPEIVLMMYNTTTKELTESGESAQDLIGNQGLQAVTNQGNVTSNSMIFYNNAVAFVTSGNVGISNALASHTLSVGSNLYVDDYGTNVLVVSGGVGITDTTTSTSATTGALKVAGGISTEENLNVGAVTKVLSATDATSKTTGALIVTGGVGISKNIHGKNVFVEDVVSNSVVILDTTDATSKTTGTLTVAGGIGVAKNIHGKNVFVEDVVSNSVVILDTTTSTSDTTGALQVAGGISTQENLNVGAVAKVLSATDASSKTTGALIVTGGVGISKNIHALNANFEDVEADSVDITDTTLSYNQTTGALKVAGGLGVAGNVHCGNLTLTGNLVVTGNTTVINANNLVVQDPIIELGKGNLAGLDTGILMNNPLTSGNKGNVAVIYDFSTSNLEIGHTLSSANNSPVIMNTSNAIAVNINGTLGVTSTTASSSKTTGAVTIGGGLGVVGDIHATHVNFEDVEADSVTITDNTTSTSATTGALKVVGGISTQENLNVGAVAKVISGTDATSKTTGALIVTGGIGVAKNIHGKNVFVEDVVSNSVVILDTTTSSSATTGALKVVGGISTQENLNVGAVAKVISATDATSKTTGALIVTGGLGVAKNIHGKNVFVEDVVSNSVVILDNTTSDSATTGALKVVGGISTQENLNVGAVAKVISATDATSKTTGALIVTGGLGVAKNIHGKNVFVEDVVSNSVVILDNTTSDSATTGALKVVGGISTQENLNVGAVAKVISGTDATSKTTGALIVTGGLGVAKNIHGKNVFVEDVVSNSVVILDTTDASSKTTGALKVSGGLGVAGNVHSSNIFAGYDLDLTSYMGRAAVGFTGETNHASFAHIDNNTTGNYALKQTEGGTTHVNAKAGQHIRLNINNSEKARLTGAGDLKVGSNVLYVDVSETSIGVNTASPEAKLHVVGNAYVSSTTDATTTTTGALIVAGGLGIAKKIVGQHANFEDVEADSVTITDNTTSDSATTGALKVVGGISTQENLNVGAVAKVISATDASSKTTGALIVTGGVGISKNIHALHANFEDVEADSVTITDNTTSDSATTGALKVVGGISTQENLNVGAVAKVISATDATSKTTGALIVTGGIGVAKNIHGKNVFVEDVVSNSVVILDTTTSSSATTGALKVVGGISTQENLNVGAVAKVISATDATSKTTGALIVTGGLGVSKNIHGKNVFVEDVVSNSVVILDTTTSSSATTGALKVVGGISTQENLNVGAVAKVISATDATSKTTGALIVTGGLGVAKNIHGKNVFVEDVVSNSVVILDTTTSTSATTGALKVVGGISTQENLHIGGVSKVYGTTASDGKTAGALIVAGGVGISGALFGAAATLDGVVTLSNATEATSSTTGALKAAGGVGIAKDVYVGERAYVTGGLITNTGGVGKKTYSYSADLGSGASIANATYVLDFTNHPFHSKVTAMLIESDDEISTMIFDVIGGKLGGGSNSAYVPALGQVSVINTSTMSTRWDPAIATALDGTTVTIKPGTTCTGTVRFNIFVEYLSHETAGRLTSITNSGSSAGTGDFGY
jgi:enhancing lycopene biosynthesis protein 2